LDGERRKLNGWEEEEEGELSDKLRYLPRCLENMAATARLRLANQSMSFSYDDITSDGQSCDGIESAVTHGHVSYGIFTGDTEFTRGR
jgi:hypothetical protein